MRIIIAPAKRMTSEVAFFEPASRPVFIAAAQILLRTLKTLDCNQIQTMLSCSAAIAEQAWHDYQHLDLKQPGAPALLSYQGIQYTTMAPHVFTDGDFKYIQQHLRILSGFYGLLRPFDGVQPHRLEMDSRLKLGNCRSLYEFWGSRLYDQLVSEDPVILDLASVQHARCIRPYVSGAVRLVKCCFMEDTAGGLREKGVYVKIARGEMVRYLTEIKAQKPEDCKNFCVRGYRFIPELSNEQTYVFVRKKEDQSCL